MHPFGNGLEQLHVRNGLSHRGVFDPGKFRDLADVRAPLAGQHGFVSAGTARQHVVLFLNRSVFTLRSLSKKFILGERTLAGQQQFESSSFGPPS